MALNDGAAFYELEEASGTRADSTAGASTLTDNNTVTQQTGIVGSCGQFTKANSEYLSHADSATLSVDGTSFAVTAWAYQSAAPAEGASNNVVAKFGGFANWEWRLRTETVSGVVRFKFDIWADDGSSDTVTATTFGTPSNSTWYFLYAELDIPNSLLRISVNDGTVNTAAMTKTIVATNAQFQIGAANSLAFWDGRIDQVGLWKRVLTSSEVTQLYNAGAGLSWAAMQPAATARRLSVTLVG